MNIIHLKNINSDYMDSLDNLITRNDGYEPYYDENASDNILHFAILDATRIIAFAGCVLNHDNKCAEFSCLVDKAFRRKGLFSALLKHCSNYIFTNYGSDYKILLPVDSKNSFLLDSSLKLDYSYSEYLMSVDCDSYKICSSADSSLLEFYYDDSENVYLMYEDSAAEQPCGVINIEEESDYINIFGVFVDEDKRGLGLGSIMLSHFLQEHFSNSYKPCILNVTSTNTAAVKLYKKAGFKETDHLDYYCI